ncbi:uncharacterized protein KY384_005347 [Bacidia gigantensis]|uniref:uncharacterized protein n=1 Tax=Bacidia gigantensis TaxID=2732470 RepID=UPI001D04805A|nr:uncharacterized protein KY384_005347 [Bacidia gigantensis]KAG8529866.1 hypothetical protein KY384_005347 [Bacidia gigantensis]
MKQVFKPFARVEMSDNTTSRNITQLPANIIEAFIPGYSIISKLLLDALGFDITFVVSACVLAVGLGTALKYIWSYVYDKVTRYLMSYIRIEYDDDIYDYVMEWVAAHTLSRNSRNLIAKTGYENHWEINDDEEGYAHQVTAEGYIDFRNWEAKKPPKYEPSYGKHFFYHKGHLLLFQRDQKTMVDSGWGGYTTMRDSEFVTLSCLGRSTNPIKELIKEAKDFYISKQKSCTTVRRPAPKQSRTNKGGSWQRAATRPSRPMQTVVLNHKVKNDVLKDVNEYLHPATPRWYSNRGIPYRRGYLLHGPPGTGKSSLAWAIAGVFGIDIYCISLVDPNLTEEELGMLFTSLPRRCVVLLEDIDSAGLSNRQEAPSAEAETKSEDPKAKAEAVVIKALEGASKKLKDKEREGISLSGLLNAIDGVASHEGRVLIMTTNFPDRLDEALTRPGRIDMKVPFTNATREQIRELFTRMYSPDTPVGALKTRPKVGNAPVQKLQLDAISTFSEKLLTTKADDANSLTPPYTPMQASTPMTSPSSTSLEDDTDIEEIAAKFAAAIPEDTLTPAEIQGFLLKHKKEPAKALTDVESWRDRVLAAKEKKALAEKKH